MDENPYASPREQSSEPISQDLFDARFMFWCGCFLFVMFGVELGLSCAWSAPGLLAQAILVLASSLVTLYGSGAALERHKSYRNLMLEGDFVGMPDSYPVNRDRPVYRLTMTTTPQFKASAK